MSAILLRVRTRAIGRNVSKTSFKPAHRERPFAFRYASATKAAILWLPTRKTAARGGQARRTALQGPFEVVNGCPWQSGLCSQRWKNCAGTGQVIWRGPVCSIQGGWV